MEKPDSSRPVKTDLGSVISPRYEASSDSPATDEPRSRSGFRRSLTNTIVTGKRIDQKTSLDPASLNGDREAPRNALNTRRGTIGRPDAASLPKPPKDELDTRFEQMMVCGPVVFVFTVLEIFGL